MWCCYSVSVLFLSLLCFFFFKQKTAYEMRISDWSSDVCSSDLPSAVLRRGPPQASLDDERQQGQVAGALDGLGQFALLLGRHRGDARGHDLAAFGNEPRQQLRVLVVDLRRIGARERAGLSAPEERATGGRRTAAGGGLGTNATPP